MPTSPSPRPGPKAPMPPRSLLLAAFLAGCVFVPPPPLPEEIAAMEAAKAARKAARPVAPEETGEPGAEGEAGAEIAFQTGAPAPEGMTPAQIRAYAAAQGDPEAGEFTLEEALAGLPGGPDDALWAVFKTPRGALECE